MTTFASESWVFRVKLDRDPDPTNEKVLCMTLDPSCIVDQGASLCDLTGWITDVDNNLSYPVTGGRGLFNGKGVVKLEFDYSAVHIKFFGFHSDDRNFKGKFVCIGRPGKAVGTFNPEDGDTGTATGSQAQCPE